MIHVVKCCPWCWTLSAGVCDKLIAFNIIFNWRKKPAESDNPKPICCIPRTGVRFSSNNWERMCTEEKAGGKVEIWLLSDNVKRKLNNTETRQQTWILERQNTATHMRYNSLLSKQRAIFTFKIKIQVETSRHLRIITYRTFFGNPQSKATVGHGELGAFWHHHKHHVRSLYWPVGNET